MPKRLVKTDYVVNGDCGIRCGLNPGQLGKEKAAIVLNWYQSALNDHKMEDLARAAGIDVSHGTIGRHRKLHLDEAGASKVDESLADKDDVEILDVILKKGATQVPGWNITPSEWFKALEMKYRLTGGDTADAMYAAMAQAGAEGDDDGSEAEDRPASVAEVGEGPSALREPLPVVGSPSGPSDVAPEQRLPYEHPSSREPLG